MPPAFTGNSDAPEISEDGRYVAYLSSGFYTNAPRSELYLRDLANSTTTWVSGYAYSNSPAVPCLAFNHQLTPDGLHLAYETAEIVRYSTALNGTIWRCNLQTGNTDLIHTNAAVSRALFKDIRTLCMSPDGRFLAFVSNAYDTPGTNTSVQLCDAQTGLSILLSGDRNGDLPTNSVCDWPAVDESGRRVFFLSTATGLVTNTLRGDYHLYLRDTQLGTTTLVDADENGTGSPISASPPSVTPDGRFVAFECADADIVPGDRNRAWDIFLRDTFVGSSELVSARDPALDSATWSAGNTIYPASLSADGRYIVFTSEADNLVPGDTNGCQDVLLLDTLSGGISLVSVGTNGSAANGPSFEPSITPDGRFVAFTSTASNLVPGDTNACWDVFLRDLQTATTVLVTSNVAGTGPARLGGYSPVASSNGQFVVFRSKSTDLTRTRLASGENLFLRDMQKRANYSLTRWSDTTPYSGGVMPMPVSVSANGRFVAFAGYTSASYGDHYIAVWDCSVPAAIYSNTFNGAYVSGLSLSHDGAKLACSFNPGARQTNYLSIISFGSGSTVLLDSAVGTNWQSLQFSGDDRWLVAVKTKVSSTEPKQVWLYDTGAGAGTLVSRSCNSSRSGTAISDFPVISPDGRFVGYRSSETNIVYGDTNGVPDVFSTTPFLKQTFFSAPQLPAPLRTNVRSCRSSAPMAALSCFSPGHRIFHRAI